MSGTPKLPNTFADGYNASRAVVAMSRIAQRIGCLGADFPRIQSVYGLAVKARRVLVDHWQDHYTGGFVGHDERTVAAIMDGGPTNPIIQSQVLYAARDEWHLHFGDLNRRFRHDHPVRRSVDAVSKAMARIAKRLPLAVGDHLSCHSVNMPTTIYTDGPVLSVNQTWDEGAYVYEVLDKRRGVVTVRLGVGQ